MLGPRRRGSCVAIPVLNEGERIVRQLGSMLVAGIGDVADVVVLDGGSTDGSVELERLGSLGVRARLVKLGPGRLGAQLRMGYAWALREGYEGIVTIDGNGKDGVEAIPSFVEALRAGYDLVQGSRFVPGGEAVRTPWARHVAIRLLHAPLVALAAGFAYTDTTNGFRGYSRRLLLDERVQPFREVFTTYELLPYLAIRAARLGWRVCELPVRRVYPERGPTPTKITLGGNIELLKILAWACLGRYDPESH